MRTWTGKIAPVGVPNPSDHVIADDATVTVPAATPLVFLVPGGTAIGSVRAAQLADGAVLATGTVTDHGVELLQAGVWMPEVDFKHLRTHLDEDGHTVVDEAEISRVVLGQLPLWPDVWITVDDPAP